MDRRPPARPVRPGGTARLARRARPDRVPQSGGTITFAGVATKSAGVFLAGIPVAGTGVGMAFLGSFRTLSALATPAQRASLISAIFIEAYTAFSVPLVVAGIATSHLGLHRTALVYCATVAGLAALALVSLLLQGRATTRTPAVEKPVSWSSDRSAQQFTGDEGRRIG